MGLYPAVKEENNAGLGNGIVGKNLFNKIKNEQDNLPENIKSLFVNLNDFDDLSSLNFDQINTLFEYFEHVLGIEEQQMYNSDKISNILDRKKDLKNNGSDPFYKTNLTKTKLFFKGLNLEIIQCIEDLTAEKRILFSSNSVQEINTHSKKLLKIFHELSNLDIISYDDLKMLDELSKEEFDKLCELFTLVKAECDLVDGNNDKLELSKLG